MELQRLERTPTKTKPTDVDVLETYIHDYLFFINVLKTVEAVESLINYMEKMAVLHFYNFNNKAPLK